MLGNVSIVGFMPLLLILIYFGFTLLLLFKKRKDGVARIKTAISMFVFGALSVLLMIFGFIEYSNASRFGADAVANHFSTQIVIGFFVSVYMFIGGVLLVRNKNE